MARPTTNIKAQKPCIDEGLRALCSIQKEGETFSLKQIATACGCHKSRIEQLEKQALTRLRYKIKQLQSELTS